MHDEMILDGQQIFLLEDSEWDVVIDSGSWAGRPVHHPETRSWVASRLAFTRAHSAKFLLGICRRSQYINWWEVISLVSADEGWRRVQVERVVCGTCGTMQLIANPTISDLYLGMDDWWRVMRDATANGSLGCANCGSALPRFALWTEVVADEAGIA